MAGSKRSSLGVTGELCEKIVAIGAGDLDAAALAAGRRLVLDGIAVGVAGACIEEQPAILAEHLREIGSAGSATALGMNLRLSPVAAALLNAVAIHSLDFEPMWNPATHALSPALASSLAAGEANGASGADILTAMVKGIEIQGWILAACGPFESLDLKFHPPGMVGPIGAAVAASHLLRLDARQLANAIGIAASRCGSLVSNTGTMTKATHPGYAASLGLEAAMLARRGFTGNGALDAEGGYAEAFLPPAFDIHTLLNFGKSFRVVEPGFAVKIFPSKITTHYAITAALQARPKVPAIDAIKSIHVVAPRVPAADRPFPETGHEGKFSIQYTLAAALLDGMVGIQTFTDERLRKADMQALLPLISVEMRSDISTQYGAGRYLELEIQLRDGATLKERCEKPRGTWGTAPISNEELEAKARDCLTIAMPAQDAEAIIEMTRRFDALDAADVARLMRLAGASAHEKN